MNKPTQHAFLFIYWVLLILFLGCLLLPTNTASAETTVTNSVQVISNSSGNSESQASVTTIINGEVVEDWSATSTEPILYSSTYTSEDVSTKETPLPTSNRDQLEAMIAQLEAIISLYVSLLNY